MRALTTAVKFNSLLIANRGEVALRVMRTAKRMGLATVAVYSDADTDALHVRVADRAVHIGGALPRESYLNIGAIIHAAQASAAQAVHPGYGFLAENAAFARAVIDAGLVWVGPPPQAMESMGNKAGAKRLMKTAGVPCIPGYDAVDQADAVLAGAAAAIGYPLMIKAAAGGGGRGMRLVGAHADFAAALATARSEALNAFGSAEVILEKAVIEPRHVEIQVFADSHGNVVHMGERDCSVQRRHQKVIEEAPSPALAGEAGATLRRHMGAMAVDAVRAIGYVGAGTIECLLDAEGQFYFMEMNTRLQVEHPVTEALTGFDFVEWQLRVAMGEVLPVNDQAEILRRFEAGGHAIEVRLCAEDPAQQFLPQSGRVLAWQTPEARAGLRVEAALETGMQVLPFYDSMLAKVIAHGRTRDEARECLARALDDTVLLGFASNKAFLAACLRHQRFAQGQATTAFIAQEGAALLAGADAGTNAASLIATALYAWRAAAHSPLAGRYELPLRVEIDEIMYAVGLKPLVGNAFEASCAEEAHEYWLSGRSGNTIFLRSGGSSSPGSGVDNETIHFAFSESRDPLVGEAQWRGRRYVVHDLTLVAALTAAADAGDAAVKAPMAGRVVAIHVKSGDAVVKGMPLLVLEAMKMEHAVTARGAGTVAALLVTAGAQVGLGQVLVNMHAPYTQGSQP